MKPKSLSHLSDQAALRDLDAVNEQERVNTAAVLAHLAEFDERQLYLQSSYPSMLLYCVDELHMDEDDAFERIQVARTARDFPAIFPALADGRLSLHAVLQLEPHLTPDTADELLAAAANKTNAEIELMLAHRFPRADTSTALTPPANDELAARPVSSGGPEPVRESVTAPDAQPE